MQNDCLHDESTTKTLKAAFRKNSAGLKPSKPRNYKTNIIQRWALNNNMPFIPHMHAGAQRADAQNLRHYGRTVGIKPKAKTLAQVCIAQWHLKALALQRRQSFHLFQAA